MPWRYLVLAAAGGRAGEADELLGALRTATGTERAAGLRALVEAPPGLWPVLDQRTRAHHWFGGGPDDLLGLVLRSMVRDGRVREDAVRGLTGVPGPAATCALALRTVDWVVPVRQRAREALRARLDPDEVVAAARLLLRLGGRVRAGDVLEEFRAALTVPAQRRSVRRLAGDTDRRTRRFGVELALELGEYVRGDLVRTALHDRDQVCRRLCAQRLLELDPDQAGRLMWARSAAVRELAVDALPDDVPATRLVAPLADRSRMVRAQARWKLYKRGEPPVEVYRRQVRRCGRTTPAHLVAGLAAGLGECGDASDLPLLARLATREPHPWEPEERGPVWPPVVRRAAVRAVGRLASPDDRCRLLLPLVDEPEPSVVREVLDALRPVAGAVPVGPVRAAVDRPEPAVRRAALRLLRAAGPWQRMEIDLELAAGRQPEAAAEARDDLRAWLSRQVYSRPDRDRLPRLRRLLGDADLPESMRRVLAVVLR